MPAFTIFSYIISGAAAVLLDYLLYIPWIIISISIEPIGPKRMSSLGLRVFRVDYGVFDG